MANQIKPIKPKRIADQVFDQLHELILRGEIKPGEKIMTERELADAFQVSRTSVRDAISKLVVMGMLENRQGQGTFVSRPGGKSHAFIIKIMDTQNASYQDLLEIRMGLECNAAALAAQRALPADIDAMKKSLAQISREHQAGRLGSDADTVFHMAVAYATHNPLQVYIMKQFHDFLAYVIKENLLALYREDKKFEAVQQQHTQMMDAIKARDPMRAYMATKRHIEFVIQTLAETERVPASR